MNPAICSAGKMAHSKMKKATPRQMNLTALLLLLLLVAHSSFLAVAQTSDPACNSCLHSSPVACLACIRSGMADRDACQTCKSANPAACTKCRAHRLGPSTPSVSSSRAYR